MGVRATTDQYRWREELRDRERAEQWPAIPGPRINQTRLAKWGAPEGETWKCMPADQKCGDER